MIEPQQGPSILRWVGNGPQRELVKRALDRRQLEQEGRNEPVASAETERAEYGGRTPSFAAPQPRGYWKWGLMSKKLPWVLWVVVGVRLLMVVTYPLNFWIADGKNYMDMLVRGVSNLIHSPGYPFIMGLPWRNPLGWALIESFPMVFQHALCLTQHMVCIAAAWVGYRVVREVFGVAVANLFVLLYLLDFRSIFVTSTVTPEWLQASFNIVVICAVYWAYKSTNSRHKLLLYSLAGFLFAATYLVKFNSVFLLTCPALIAAADVRRSGKAVLAIGSGVVTSMATYALFLVAFHQPSTGTFAITLDKAWVLMEKAAMFVPDRTLLPETGINTKRLIVLNALLPSVEHRGPIAHIDFVADAVRAPYREKYMHLFFAGHEELDTLLCDIEIQRPFEFNKAFLPSAYYLDLAESNRLCIAVFREQVVAHWESFIGDIIRRTRKQFIQPNTALHPTNPMDFRKVEVQGLGWGFVRLKLNTHQMRESCFWYDQPVVWRPGAKIFFLLSKVQDYPAPWVPLLVGIGCMLALRSWWRTGTLQPQVFAQLVVALTCFLFVVASNTLYNFRWKELHAILPLLAVLCSVSIVDLVGHFCAATGGTPGAMSFEGQVIINVEGDQRAGQRLT